MIIPTEAAIPAPQLAQSYATGVGLLQKDQQLAAEVQLKRDQLAQEANQAQLAASLKQQQLQMESMKTAQALEVEKSYQQQSLALKSQDLEQQQQAFELKSQQAAREMQAQEAFKTEVSDLMTNENKTPSEAFAIAYAKLGPALGGNTGTAAAEAFRPGSGSSWEKPQAFDLTDETTGQPTGQKAFRSSQYGVTLLPDRSTSGVSEVAPGQLSVTQGGKPHYFSDPTYKRLTDEVKKMQSDLSNPMGIYGPGIAAANKAMSGSGELSPFQKSALKSYLDAKDEYAKKQRELQNYHFGGGTNTAPPAASGIRIKSIRVKGE